MTGQEELEYIKVLHDRVVEQEYFVKELKSTLDGLTAIQYDKDRVQGSVMDDPMLTKLVKIEEEEHKLDLRRKRWMQWKIRCMQKIHNLDVDDLQKLLYVVYIDGYNLREASKIMGYSYDYFTKLHRKAIFKYDHSCQCDVC